MVSITTITDTVPQEQLSKVLEEHDFSPTVNTHYFNCLLIDTGERKILVDAGWGSCTRRLQGKLLQLLKIEGIAPQAIDLIVLTHGDRDHFAGIIDTDDRLVFPNARYVIGKDAWDWYASEANLIQLPEEFGVLYRKALPLIQYRVELVDTEIEVLPGIRIIPASGYKLGHLALAISSGGEELLHVADAIGHSILMEYPEWRWPADALPEQALQTRRRLFNWAAAQKCQIFGSHMPFPGLGYVATYLKVRITLLNVYLYVFLRKLSLVLVELFPQSGEIIRRLNPGFNPRPFDTISKSNNLPAIGLE